MVIAAASSIYLRSSYCHFCSTESIGCSTSYGATSSRIKSPLEVQGVSRYSGKRFKRESLFFGATHFHWLPFGQGHCPSKVSVSAASDSVPGSSNYVGRYGYHPLEEIKDCKRVRNTKLTSAEIARTTVEANSSALLIFPATVHCEPHDHISWAEFQYVMDEYGDIFFKILDEENILQDRGASNPVNALIGMDIPPYDNRRLPPAEYNDLESDFNEDIPSDDDYFEIEGSEKSNFINEWDMPEISSNLAHPIYFAKCLTKAVNVEYAKKMAYPSNGVSIRGCLRPTFIEEEVYLRRLFDGEDGDGYSSEWRDGESWDLSSMGDGSCSSSTIYRLEIMRIELFSVYGIQSAIRLSDFQDAEPDILVHWTPAIVERFNENGVTCDLALRALCKKKGLHIEEANLIGVDSLGIDVRVFSGVEVHTHRFPFRTRATSESAAEKQINQLLFPRSRRKKLRNRADRLSDVDTI